MNIIELEEGLRNLIATQPAVLSGPHASVIGGIKNIIEAHKMFIYRVDEYPQQDVLKVGLLNESSKLEINLVSYVCQILQERGINIMLYVPKYAAVYDQQINKYVDRVLHENSSLYSNANAQISQAATPSIIENAEQKYMVVEKKENDAKIVEESKQKHVKRSSEKQNSSQTTKSQGRDYLMELLKK